jgi:hypothetical protein
MAISAGQEGPIWAEDNGIDRPPCKTCTSCPDATSQSRIITSTTQAKNTLSGLTGLGVAKGHFLAKEAVSFSSYGTMGRNGTRYALFPVDQRRTGPFYCAFLLFYEMLWSCMEIS